MSPLRPEASTATWISSRLRPPIPRLNGAGDAGLKEYGTRYHGDMVRGLALRALLVALALGLGGCAGSSLAGRDTEPEPCAPTVPVETCLELQMLEDHLAALQRRRRIDRAAMMERQRYLESKRSSWIGLRGALR